MSEPLRRRAAFTIKKEKLIRAVPIADQRVSTPSRSPKAPQQLNKGKHRADNIGQGTGKDLEIDDGSYGILSDINKLSEGGNQKYSGKHQSACQHRPFVGNRIPYLVFRSSKQPYVHGAPHVLSVTIRRTILLHTICNARARAQILSAFHPSVHIPITCRSAQRESSSKDGCKDTDNCSRYKASHTIPLFMIPLFPRKNINNSSFFSAMSFRVSATGIVKPAALVTHSEAMRMPWRGIRSKDI